MQFQPAAGQGRQVLTAIADSPPAINLPTTKEIPYDYVAKFALQGNRGNRVQDVINISVEGAFVAVAIGYSFIPAPLPIKNSTVEDTQTDGGISLAGFGTGTEGAHPLISFIEPFVRPLQEILPPDNPIARERQLQQLELIRLVSECTLLKLCGIQFKYSIVDSGSGRELQNQPIYNLAGLGESSGERPFRPLAKPMVFLPRSTIRIEIEEISTGPLYQNAELYMVLHGYKMLNYGTALP